MDPNVGADRCLRVKTPKLYDDPNVDDVIEGKITFHVEEKLRDEKFDISSAPEALLRLEGKDFDLKYIQQNGFNTPIMFKQKDGLGLKVPDPSLFSVNDVKSYVGSRRVIDVFDCGTHQPEKMSVHQFVKYYTSEHKDHVLNVTSLEFSHTGLDRIVDGPTTVREDLDWVPLVWPKALYDEQKDTTNTIENMKYPKVRKYVLMSVGGCYTDFHIDFGGTSVWYHVLKGAKIFWVIPPTERNFELFEQWALSPLQKDEFFGDLVENCYRIHLKAGDTFMIPTGWIHSVYTPEDALVFGGNYLHSFNIPLQLRVYDMEEATHVPKHLRFPFYTEIHWYMIKTYVEILERDLDERRAFEFEEDTDGGGVFKLLDDEMNKCGASEENPKRKWQCVHLTVQEVDGLKLLCERLRGWAHAKLHYPKTLSEDSMELLDRLEELLQYHEDDDQVLACSGINIFKQYKDAIADSAKSISHIENEEIVKEEKKAVPKPPTMLEERPKRQRKLKEYAKEEAWRLKEKRRKKFLKKERTVIRRVRCNECEGCHRGNCNECRFCVDMKKNGGLGKLRQSCQMRFCENPQLPAYVTCRKCDEDRTKEILMECSICAEIIHPSCSERKAPCKISKKVNNSWECPKCCQSDEEATEFSMEQVGQVVSTYKKKILESLSKGVIPNKSNKVLSLKRKTGSKLFNKLNNIRNVKENKIKKIKQEEQNFQNRGHSQSEGSDDEPLIKKRNKKSEENGHNVNPPPVIIQPLLTVRPGPIRNPYFFVMKEDGTNHIVSREMWVHVFTYLSDKQINACMLVCKAWNQWCLDHRLWPEICVNDRPLTPSIAAGVVRRQPASLSLSSTGVSGKQLEWLLNRLPRLKSLDVSLNTASAVCALTRVSCSPITRLNLSWCDAIFDSFMSQLLAPIRSDRAETIGMCRLQFLQNLNLTGCDVATQTLHSVFTCLKYLRHFDVSHCSRVKDTDFDIVRNGNNVNKETLKRIICIGCRLVTEQYVVEFMSKENMPSLVLSIS